MAKVKTLPTKLGVMHHIGYGAGDAGGVLMLMMISLFSGTGLVVLNGKKKED